MAARGELEAVITLDPGRLSRSIAHLVLLTEEFEQNGVELLFATSPNEDTSVGERLLQLRNARSNAKSGEISERTRRILS
jgi:site-specific DNA recombinase